MVIGVRVGHPPRVNKNAQFVFSSVPGFFYGPCSYMYI